MVQMLSALGSGTWECPCFRVTGNLSSVEEDRFVNKQLAVYALELAGNYYMTDSGGVVQLGLIGSVEDFIA